MVGHYHLEVKNWLKLGCFALLTNALVFNVDTFLAKCSKRANQFASAAEKLTKFQQVVRLHTNALKLHSKQFPVFGSADRFLQRRNRVGLKLRVDCGTNIWFLDYFVLKCVWRL